MNHFITRLIGLLLLAAFIGGYQSKVLVANQAAEIEAMESALEEAKSNLEAKITDQQNTSEETTEEDTGESSESGFKDGTYQGQAQGYGGIISVDVTIKDGAITNIEITSAENEDTAYLSMATSVIDLIINEQSTGVDAISGATYSSTGIKNAVAQAVMKAIGE